MICHVALCAFTRNIFVVVHQTGHADSAFYLTPSKLPKGEIWFSKIPLGHNMLQKTIPQLMQTAGYDGYYTNHSLRVSAATHLVAAGVDEQLLIMSRTGH